MIYIIYGGMGHHYGGQEGCTYEHVSIQIIEQVELANDAMIAKPSSTGKTNSVALLRMSAMPTASEKNTENPI